MIHGAKRFFIYMIIVLLLLGTNCPAVFATEEKDTLVLTVAFPEAKGLNEVYEDGTYGGCVYDWLEEIAKYTGWQYEFVTGDSSELLVGMQAGAYDLMGGMFYQKELEKYYNYPKYIMGSNYSLLIYRQNDETIKSFDYNTLNGKRIGVLKKATAKIERLQKFLSFNNLDCQLIAYDDLEAYENCLDTHEVDLLFGSDVYMKDNYNVAAKIEGDPYYIVTKKDRPDLCHQLNEAMDAIYAANPNFAHELYNQYFPETYINSIDFTTQEIDFIRQSAPIRVAVVKEQYPIYYEKDEVKKGILPDCLQLISQRTGLTFSYVYANSYQQSIELVIKGQADIVGCFMNNDPSAASYGLARTRSYATLDSIILRNKQGVVSDASLVMAVPNGRDLKPLRTEDTIRYYDRYETCLRAVNAGAADYTRMPAAFVEDMYLKDYYANITMMADTNLVEEMTLALPLPVNVPLYSVLSKTINNLSAEELDYILAQDLLTIQKRSVTLKTLLYTNPLTMLVVCVGFILLLSMIILLFTRYKMNNKMMGIKLEKAEETSKAKSDFLSRMSHEIRTPMNAIIGLTSLTRMSDEITPGVKQNLDKINSSAQFLLSLLNDVLDMSKIESQKMKIESIPFDLIVVAEQMKNMFTIQAENKGLTLTIHVDLVDSLFVGDEIRIKQILTNLLSNACKYTNQGGAVLLSVTEQNRITEKATIVFCVKDTGIGIKGEDLERIFHSFEQLENSNHNAPGTGLGLAITSNLVQLMGGELKVKSQPQKGSAFYFAIQLPVFQGTLPSAQKEAEDNPEVSLQGLHVLLVEDNDINAEIAMELLEMQDVMVERAADGAQAVALFAQKPEGYFDLILMDINMPVKNGLMATEEIRAMQRADANIIPILAMTANTFQEDREKAMAAGMTGFLPKPFDVNQLYQALRQSMNKK